MATLETALIAGASAVGGWFALRRLHDWDPDGDRLGEVVARTGSGAADLLGKVVEGTGGVVAITVRTGGHMAAKTAGAVVGGAEVVAYKVVPGVGGSDGEGADAPAEEEAPATPAKKKAAKKPAAKKSAKKSAAKK